MKLTIALVSTLKLSAAHDANAADLPQHLQDKAVLNNSADKTALLITDDVPQRTRIDGASLRGIDLSLRGSGSGGSHIGVTVDADGGESGGQAWCGRYGDSIGGRNPENVSYCGGFDIIQLKIDCDIGDSRQSTNDNIRMYIQNDHDGVVSEPVCGVPGGQCHVDRLGYGGDFYLPQTDFFSSRHISRFCVLPTDKLIIETDGTDAFIIDKLWIRGDINFEIGGNNHAGMCLSRDPGDAAVMGDTAYGGHCPGVSIDLATRALEYWGC